MLALVKGDCMLLGKKSLKNYVLFGLFLCFPSAAIMCSESISKKHKQDLEVKLGEGIALMKKSHYPQAKVILEQVRLQDGSSLSVVEHTLITSRACLELAKISKLSNVQNSLGAAVFEEIDKKIDALILPITKLRELYLLGGRDLVQSALHAVEFQKKLPQSGMVLDVYKNLVLSGLLTGPFMGDEAKLTTALSDASEVVNTIGLGEAMRITNEITKDNQLLVLRRLEDIGSAVKFLRNHPDWKNSNSEEIRCSLRKAFKLGYEEAVKLMWIFVMVEGSQDLLIFTQSLFHQACLARNSGLVKFFLLRVAEYLKVTLNLDSVSKTDMRNEQSWVPSWFPVFGSSREEKEVAPEFASFLDSKIESVEGMRNPLEIALTYDDEVLMGLLVLARADISYALRLWSLRYKDMCSFQQWTSLHLASWLNKPLVVKIALNAQSQAKDQRQIWLDKDIRGRNAFHIAIMMGWVDVANALFDGNPHQFGYAIDNDGMTPLALAVEREFVEGRNDIVSGLLAPARSLVQPEELNAKKSFVSVLLDLDPPLDDSVEKMREHKDSDDKEGDKSVNKRAKFTELAVGRRKPLHVAAQLGSQSAVKIIAQSSWSWNLRNLFQERDGYGKMPIHYAVESGKLDMLNLLLLMDGSSNFHRDSDGNTPLHLAARTKMKTVFDRLVEVSFIDCIYAENNYGKTVMHVAIENKLPIASIDEIFKKHPSLLNKVDSMGRTPLYLAVLYGYSELVEYLLGVNPVSDRKAKIIIATKDNGDTVLHLAVRKGDSNIAQLVINAAHDTDLFCRDNVGKSPIHHAAEANHADVFVALGVKQPGCVWVIDDKGETPLHVAARAGFFEIANKLVDVGFFKKISEYFKSFVINDTALKRFINKTNLAGQTALHLVVLRCEEVIIKRDQEEDGAFKVLECLCKNGLVDRSIKDKNEKRAIDYAKRADVILLLGGYEDKDGVKEAITEKVTDVIDFVGGTVTGAAETAKKAVEALPSKVIK